MKLGQSAAVPCPLFGSPDELFEEGDRQRVLLAGALGPMQLAVILHIHALAGIRRPLLSFIVLVIFQLHLHPADNIEKLVSCPVPFNNTCCYGHHNRHLHLHYYHHHAHLPCPSREITMELFVWD